MAPSSSLVLLQVAFLQVALKLSNIHNTASANPSACLVTKALEQQGGKEATFKTLSECLQWCNLLGEECPCFIFQEATGLCTSATKEASAAEQRMQATVAAALAGAQKKLRNKSPSPAGGRKWHQRDRPAGAIRSNGLRHFGKAMSLLQRHAAMVAEGGSLAAEAALSKEEKLAAQKARIAPHFPEEGEAAAQKQAEAGAVARQSLRGTAQAEKVAAQKKAPKAAEVAEEMAAEQLSEAEIQVAEGLSRLPKIQKKAADPEKAAEVLATRTQKKTADE